MVYKSGLRQFTRQRSHGIFINLSAVVVCSLAIGLVYIGTMVTEDQSRINTTAAIQSAAKGQFANSKTQQGSAHGGSSLKVRASTKLETVARIIDTVNVPSCTGGPVMHQGLNTANSAQLRKLAQYEQLCASAPISQASFFAPTPTNTASARSAAYDVATQLNEFARYGIQPLVFMEPMDNGSNIDLDKYQSGSYDQALASFYAELRNLGIDDASMGTWVVLPEGNMPEWSSVDPGTYRAVVTKTAQLQKKQFPASHVSLMLDSESYPTANSWSGGRYVSLLPYVQNIPKGLIDSFGLQGFPWAAPAGQSGSSFDPATYLRTDLAIEAARALAVKDIWVNTGTFHEMYAGQGGKTVFRSPQQRQVMLNGVIAQMKTVQNAGFDTAIHIFAEDKSAASEGTDWSYWKTSPSGADAAVFATLVHDARSAGIPLWLYDAAK